MKQISPLKTAVVGCGVISNVYIRNLKNLFSIIDLCAVCDIRLESAKQKAEMYGVEHIMTMDELAADKDIELVINLTAPAAHYSVIKQMLLAGKNVFTEKLMTEELWQAKELLEIANAQKLYLGVAPDTVLGAGIQTARGIIDAGMIGTVTSAVATVNRNHSLNSELFPFIKQSAASAFPLNVGVYYIAALLSLLGPVQKVSGLAAKSPMHKAELLFKAQSLEDEWVLPGTNLLSGVMEFCSGAIGNIHFDGNSINHDQSGLVIYGTKGILRLGDPNTFGGSVELLLPGARSCMIPHTYGYDGVPTLDNPTQFEVAYGHRGIGAAEMAWAIRKQRECRCSKEFGYHTMEVLFGLDESAKTDHTIETESRFTFKPLQSGFYSSFSLDGMNRGDAERSLID